jgi:transcriptional regulator with XRE-family HTH domain
MGNSSNGKPRRHVYTVPTPEDTYGHRIRKERLAHGWDQTELAAMVDSEQTVISALERNARKAPNPVLLTRLEEVLSLPPKTLTDLARWTNPLHLPQPGDVIIPNDEEAIVELAHIAQKLPTHYLDKLLEIARLYAGATSAAAEG